MGDGTERDDVAAAQANDWLSKAKLENLKERAEFAAWLRASPRNIAELLLTTAFHQELANTDFAAPKSRPTQRPPRRRRRVALLTAGLGILGIAAYAARQEFSPHRAPTVDPPAVAQIPEHIQFNGRTLEEVASEFNRHNARK